MKSSHFKKILTALVLVALSVLEVRAGAVVLRHHLKIRLLPAENMLTGIDEIRVQTRGEAVLNFNLSQRAKVKRVEVNGRSLKLLFKKGNLRIPLATDERTGVIKIKIAYQGVFDDPVPVMPVNTDNPGYGVTGIISEKGSFLLSGAGWYPEIPGSHPAFTLDVNAPAGVFAVTAGKLSGHETDGKRTRSAWVVNHPVDGLSLSAARYRVREKQAGKVKAMTYMLPENDHLSESYLNAVVRYISDYETLFGSYPFDKFAVVENFFPTGYGFPSYTLLGSRVLRLPFIIRTSLGHEIAHCWWGNGVYVDYEKGNWCEGLTTYVSDYRFKEKISDGAAREYRRQWLRNFATLVNPENDFPLSQFKSRYDPVTRAIGYDKGAMVFHMLRIRLGEAVFWGTLRDLYRDNLFQKVSWVDLQAAFERRGNRSLEQFFTQWVYRKGAVQLSLEGMSKTLSGDSWKMKGHLVQQQPLYNTTLKLKLEGGYGHTETEVILSGRDTPFEIVGKELPERITVDPDFDVFRMLYPSEIPSQVNSLKGSSSVLVVLAKGVSLKTKNTARLLVASLGLRQVRFISEKSLINDDLNRKDILIVGFPTRQDL
ncbi:M1 family metallopeptidase, partial [Thermodesulfobacteriota bacterium]